MNLRQSRTGFAIGWGGEWLKMQGDLSNGEIWDEF